MSPDEQERRRSRTVHFTDKLAGKMAEGVSLFTLKARRVLVSLDSAGTAALRGPTALGRYGKSRGFHFRGSDVNQTLPVGSVTSSPPPWFLKNSRSVSLMLNARPQFWHCSLRGRPIFAG
jgi:hypothetical protein